MPWIYFLVKAFYCFQKLIFGIDNGVYRKGTFVLGPLLLLDERNFRGDVRQYLPLAGKYIKKLLILSSIYCGIALLARLLIYVASQ